jgi:subtilisin family serine protease
VGLRNTGQPHHVTYLGTEASGTPGADISVSEASEIQRGSPETIIAVLDDGVDIEHPDLAANLWTNPGEIPDNDVDYDDNVTRGEHGLRRSLVSYAGLNRPRPPCRNPARAAAGGGGAAIWLSRWRSPPRLWCCARLCARG